LGKDLYANFISWPSTWSADGIYLYYQTKDPKGSFGVIRHFNGSEYARIPLLDLLDWNKNDIMISFSRGHIITYHVRNNILDTIGRRYTYYSLELPMDIEWLPDNRNAVFIQDNGMFRVDTESGEILQIKEMCDIKCYEAISVSDKGNYILCEKKITRRHSYYDYHEYSEIWKMDVNGCREIRILPTTAKYETNPYNEDTDEFAKSINSSYAPHKTEFNAKFLPKALNLDFIDNVEITSTKLKDAIKPEALAMIDSVLSRQTGEWKVVKVYPKNTSSNHKILNVRENSTDVLKLFAWLKITIPEGEDIEEIVQELRKLNKVFFEIHLKYVK